MAVIAVDWVPLTDVKLAILSVCVTFKALIAVMSSSAIVSLGPYS
jgi:hypothetical protein